MANINEEYTNGCSCECDGIELQSELQPGIVVTEDGCCCGDVQLYSECQPDILLFDEYGGYEEYKELIEAAKDARAAAEEAREAASHVTPIVPITDEQIDALFPEEEGGTE